MMKCSGCYTEVKEGYCLACRKKLFGKARVSNVLDFDAPKAGNLASYQEHTKRLSISGVQLKYSLRLEARSLILHDTNGQYLLKPIPPANQLHNIEAAPENEHLTMHIAEQLFKINTAVNGLIYFKDGQPAYITKRFDVKSDGSKYMQEDFAQLTERTKYTHGESFKYDGSYEEIGQLIKKYVAAAIPALERFFQLVVFNYVFSNGDAHLKNFSLIRNDAGEYQLTPAYDLMSTVIHTPLESDTALDLYPGAMNSEYYKTYGFYSYSDFKELASRLGIVPQRSERIINRFINQQEPIEQFIKNSLLPEDLISKYIHNIKDKIQRLQLRTK